MGGDARRRPAVWDRWAAAVDAFLGQPDLAPGTRRSYRLTLATLRRELGRDLTQAPTAPTLRAATITCFVHTGPATWNRHAAALESFVRYAAREGLLAPIELDLPRRRVPGDQTRSVPRAALARLWARDDVPLRDKTLWRLLYESAARASEALALDIEDLDPPNRRALLVGKGGERDYIHWQSGTARLLPRLIGDRRSGPLFLTNRRPAPGRAPAIADLCPLTGRARLSYRRAEEIFNAATGWTLHQLRHSAITHLAEQNVSLPLLMAKSRHASLRSLQRYARPGPDAVAALTAAYDPARRR